MTRKTLLAALAIVSLAIGCNKASETQEPAAPGNAGQTSMQTQPATEPAASVVTFASIKPILDRSCVKCHGARNPREEVNLTTYADTMKGGEHGEIVKPGDPDNSRMMKFIRGEETPRMPYNQPPLPDEEIALIAEWIKQGAKEA